MGREVRGTVCRLDSSASWWGPVADSGDHSNNLLCSMKGREYPQ